MLTQCGGLNRVSKRARHVSASMGPADSGLSPVPPAQGAQPRGSQGDAQQSCTEWGGRVDTSGAETKMQSQRLRLSSLDAMRWKCASTQTSPRDCGSWVPSRDTGGGARPPGAGRGRTHTASREPYEATAPRTSTPGPGGRSLECSFESTGSSLAGSLTTFAPEVIFLCFFFQYICN